MKVGLGSSTAFATWIQAITTVLLAALTGYYVHLTSGMMKVQIDPVVDFELVRPDQVLIRNDGILPIHNVAVNFGITIRDDSDAVLAAVNIGDARHWKNARNWQFFEALRGGEEKLFSAKEVLGEAWSSFNSYQKSSSEVWLPPFLGLVSKKYYFEYFDRGILGSKRHPPKAKLRLLITFQGTFQRDFDKKRYVREKTARIYGAPATKMGGLPNDHRVFFFMEMRPR